MVAGPRGGREVRAHGVVRPASGVRLVSFFVTARWFGQSDWTAFLRVVVEAAGQPMPDLSAEAAPAGVFHRLLEAAAASCAQAGERLALVVDGLDEDRGVTAGPGEHSIAALLPANPPPGVRVLVSGRPDRPVPRDVPSSHPLRSPEVVRPLAVSAQEACVRGRVRSSATRMFSRTINCPNRRRFWKVRVPRYQRQVLPRLGQLLPGHRRRPSAPPHPDRRPPPREPWRRTRHRTQPPPLADPNVVTERSRKDGREEWLHRRLDGRRHPTLHTRTALLVQRGLPRAGHGRHLAAPRPDSRPRPEARRHPGRVHVVQDGTAHQTRRSS
ncbi:hypothetical protein QF027_001620 [Streptomyces canus]|nr:hypothetical protein [Streptomyces canus]